MKRIRVGEMDIPTNYFEFSDDEKKLFCNQMIDVMLRILDRNLREGINRIETLDSLLISSIQTNLEDEKYEICAVLNDIRTILNEQED